MAEKTYEKWVKDIIDGNAFIEDVPKQLRTDRLEHLANEVFQSKLARYEEYSGWEIGLERIPLPYRSWTVCMKTCKNHSINSY